MNNTYANDTEYCVMAREKGSKLYGDFNSKRKYYITSLNQQDKKEYYHPTIKPLEFVKNHIINSTKEGDIVLDCFIGSGTTAVACKELGRNFIGFESNPIYYQIAIDRLKGVFKDNKKQRIKILSIEDFLGGKANEC